MDAKNHYAHAEVDPALEAVMRFQAVKRWHMVDTTKIQTLAEHSANVALLATYIAHTAPEMYFGPSELVTFRALVHDIPEVFTGDVPSHSKKWLTGFKELEEAVTPRWYTATVSEDLKLLIKLCDLADGIRFIDIHGVDSTATHAQEGLRKQLDDRFNDAADMWPDNVYMHVFKVVRTYMVKT